MYKATNEVGLIAPVDVAKPMDQITAKILDMIVAMDTNAAAEEIDSLSTEIGSAQTRLRIAMRTDLDESRLG